MNWLKPTQPTEIRTFSNISRLGLIAHAKRMTLGYFPPITMWNWEASRPLSPASLSFSTLAVNPTILKRFGTEQTNLLQISQNNPRRNLQLRYVREIAKVEEVPE